MEGGGSGSSRDGALCMIAAVGLPDTYPRTRVYTARDRRTRARSFSVRFFFLREIERGREG